MPDALQRDGYWLNELMNLVEEIDPGRVSVYRVTERGNSHGLTGWGITLATDRRGLREDYPGEWRLMVTEPTLSEAIDAADEAWRSYLIGTHRNETPAYPWLWFPSESGGLTASLSDMAMENAQLRAEVQRLTAGSAMAVYGD